MDEFVSVFAICVFMLICVVGEDSVATHALRSHVSQSSVYLDVGITYLLNMSIDHGVRIAPSYLVICLQYVIALLGEDRSFGH